jgi:methylated-DNA-[protein]-cysteine S-methyltransferase
MIRPVSEARPWVQEESVAPPDTVTVGTIETRIGCFDAAVSPLGLGRLVLPAEPPGGCEAWACRWWPAARVIRGGPALAALDAELRAYLKGRRSAFTVPVDLRGTPFQTRVWRALAGIPYGQTRTYVEIAAAIGRPRAVRAVGAANGANPVPVVVPCHRVIAADGGLTGYRGRARHEAVAPRPRGRAARRAARPPVIQPHRAGRGDER